MSSEWDEPCLSCKYREQACAYILDGKNMEDACMSERLWLKIKVKQTIKNTECKNGRN